MLNKLFGYRNKSNIKSVINRFFLSIGTVGGALAFSYLFVIVLDYDYFEIIPLFVLAVVLTSRYSEGYFYGIFSALLSVLLVNFFLIKPFYTFNFAVPGYFLLIVALIATSVVISALKKELQIKEFEKLDMDRENMRTNFLRSISHDIRTPLTGILGSAETLIQNRSLPEKDKIELLQEIANQAKWLVRIAENILSITRLKDCETIDKSDEVIEDIIGSSIIKFRRQENKINITVDRPKEILCVPMDATLIQQVIINLLENVQKHAENAQNICIKVEDGADGVHFYVSDDGTGIEQDVLKKIFTYTADKEADFDSSTRRNKYIGLSVCKTVIEAHGGKIEAYNNICGGATFHFILPKLSADEA